jgi:uncharacterized protein
VLGLSRTTTPSATRGETATLCGLCDSRRDKVARSSPRTTMLELRPICEHCATPLPPEAPNAVICTFECTFCSTCAHTLLGDVCPNCGGNFVQRPIRPRENRKGDNYLGQYPATKRRKHRPVDLAAHAEFAARMQQIDPTQR